MAVANGNKNKHESDTARSQAEKLIKQYGITFDSPEDKAKAFDIIIDQLVPILDTQMGRDSGSVFSVVGPILQEADIKAKASMIGKIEKGLKIWEVLGIQSPIINGVKSIFDNAIKNNKGK